MIRERPLFFKAGDGEWGFGKFPKKIHAQQKLFEKKIVGNCEEINLASAFTAFNHPGPVIDFKKIIAQVIAHQKKSRTT